MRALALAALLALAAWFAWPRQEAVPPSTTRTPMAVPERAPAATGPQRQWLATLAAAPERPSAAPGPAAPAWISMAEARSQGDPRTPPLQRAPAQPGPTAGQLADPQAYRRFEQDQHARVLGAFAAAVQDEAPRLRADIERGRAAGVDAAALARAEAKLERLERLRRGIEEQGRVPPD